MIAVIADDFTGAAELGGIGLRYGLTVEISTEVNSTTNADLIVIDADTRSGNETNAIQKIEKITQALTALKPEWIYKKTDSVLRGHVVAELNAQMKTGGRQRALLVPANPDLGRTIQNGIYFFNNKPVHESSFSIDPEFAITSSDVPKMLKAPVHMLKLSSPLPASGIIVGEASEMKDLDHWAAQCDKDILPAGAAGFFTAILDSRKKKKNDEMRSYQPQLPVLYVSGTTFKKSTEAIKKIKAAGGPVIYLPANEQINTYEKLIIAIDPDIQGNAVELRNQTAEIVEKILKQHTTGEVFIEGGSTARAVFDRLGYHRFYPVQELAPGVVRMKVKENDGIYITVKPGSYAWPTGTWIF